MTRVRATKLGHRKDAKHNSDERPSRGWAHWSVLTGDVYEGRERAPAKVGECYWLDCHGGTWFHTSTVKSIYEYGSERDKLMLPRDFPESALHLDFPKMKKGDMLLATQNSVYWVESLEARDRTIAARLRDFLKDMVEEVRNLDLALV